MPRPFRGNSRAYIISRLQRIGRHDLVTAIEAGVISAYAVAIELGWITRPPNLGTGPTNQAKRRAIQMRRLGL